MRRRLIQVVLPLVFSLVPVLSALLIVAMLPPKAFKFYVQQLTDPETRTDHLIDYAILGAGLPLFAVQLVLGWRAMQWRGSGFDERPDKWLQNLIQAAEWFPLLGLIGTVAGILQTFSSITSTTAPERIIQMYAPAITATGSGLFMVRINHPPRVWPMLIGPRTDPDARRPG